MVLLLLLTYFAADEPFVNYTSGAQYYNGSYATNHGVTLVGWDDTYSASNFDVRPPGDGAWIIKNSWGTNAGVDGYFYISYYDTCFAMKNSYAYMISNTEQYNKNYQYDLQGNLGYLNIFNQYKNVYIAEDDDLIGAVGTYFNQSNVTYTIKVYVNDSLKYVEMIKHLNEATDTDLHAYDSESSLDTTAVTRSSKKKRKKVF